MEGRLLIRECAVWQSGAAVPGLSVRVEADRVAEVAPAPKLKALPGDWVVEARGRLLTPGLVDGWAGAGGGLAQERLRIATALRQGVTCTVVSADAPGPTAEAANELGARAVVALPGAPTAPADAPLLRLLGASPAELARPSFARGAADRGAPGSVRVDAPEPVAGALMAVTCDGAARGLAGKGGWPALASGGAGRAWDAWVVAQRVAAPGAGAVLFDGPGAWQGALFGGVFGRVEAGAAADLALWDVVPGPGFALDALAAAIAAWVVVAGRVVVREGQLVGVDYLGLAAAAR